MKTKILAGLGALALVATAAPAFAASQNLIVNGTFDNTTTGWTGTYSTRDSDPDIDTGSYFFPGAGAFHAIYQHFSLTSEQVSNLAGPGLGFTLSADLFGWHNQEDRGTLSVFFMDAEDNRIDSATLISSTLYDGWWDTTITAGGKYFQSLSGLVPVNTTALTFMISSTRIGGGTNNDGYIDNASFSLDAIAPVPLPAALPMLGAGFALLVGAARRNRSAA